MGKKKQLRESKHSTGKEKESNKKKDVLACYINLVHKKMTTSGISTVSASYYYDDEELEQFNI